MHKCHLDRLESASRLLSDMNLNMDLVSSPSFSSPYFISSPFLYSALISVSFLPPLVSFSFHLFHSLSLPAFLWPPFSFFPPFPARYFLLFPFFTFHLFKFVFPLSLISMFISSFFFPFPSFLSSLSSLSFHILPSCSYSFPFLTIHFLLFPFWFFFTFPVLCSFLYISSIPLFSFLISFHASSPSSSTETPGWLDKWRHQTPVTHTSLSHTLLPSSPAPSTAPFICWQNGEDVQLCQQQQQQHTARAAFI